MLSEEIQKIFKQYDELLQAHHDNIDSIRKLLKK